MMHGHGHWKHRGRGRRMLASMWGPWRQGPYQFGSWAMWGAGMGDECPGVEGQCGKRCWKKWSKKCVKERDCSKEGQMEGSCGKRCLKKWNKRCGNERDGSEEQQTRGVSGRRFCKKWNKRCRVERESFKERQMNNDSESDTNRSAEKHHKKVKE